MGPDKESLIFDVMKQVEAYNSIFKTEFEVMEFIYVRKTESI
jgi:hypothetical protein